MSPTDEDTAAGSLPSVVTAVTPDRVLDTQAAGIPAAGGSTTVVPVLGVAGVPGSGVSAVLLNVTATGPTDAGFLTVFPDGTARPGTTNDTFTAGATRSNVVMTPVGSDGSVDIYAGTAASVNLQVDVQGWLASTATFTPVTASRLTDTRFGGGTGAGVAPNTAITVAPLGEAGVPATGVDSVVLDVTAYSATSAGYLSVTPDASNTPSTSTVAFSPGVNATNMVIAKLGADGRVNVRNGSYGQVQIAADVLGYFPGDDSFHSIDPARLVNTRASTTRHPTRGAVTGIPAGGSLVVSPLGHGTIPTSGVGSIVLTVTTVAQDATGFTAVYPTGSPAPTTGNINSTVDQLDSSTVVAPLGTGGTVTIYNGTAGAMQYIVDTTAWLPLDLNTVDQAVTTMAPASSTITAEGAQLATISYGSGTPVPSVGTLVAGADAGGNPVYGRIDMISGQTAAMTQVPLSTVVPFADFDVSAPDADSDVGATVVGPNVSHLQVGHAAADGLPDATLKCDEDGITGDTPTADVKLDGSDVYVRNVHANVHGLTFDVTGDIGYDLKAAIDISDKAECKASKALLTKNLPTIAVDLGPIPVVIKQSISIDLDLSASVEGGVTYDYSLSRGSHFDFTNSGGGVHLTRTSIGSGSSVDSEINDEAEASASLELSYTAAVYGVLDLTGKLTAEVTATAYVDRTPHVQVDYKITLSLEASIHINLFFLHINASDTLAEATLASGHLASFDWSKGGPAAATTGLPPASGSTNPAPPASATASSGTSGGIATGGTTGAGHAVVSQGPTAPYGFRYGVALSGYAPGETVEVTCFDSVSNSTPFWTFTVTTDGAGNGNIADECYSADGPEHWVDADGVESNHVVWGAAGAAPVPVSTSAAVSLAQGPAAPFGYRYAVTLTGFPGNSSVAVECYDTQDPSGFYMFHVSTDINGHAFVENECYSAAGPDYYVGADGVESNHVSWGTAASGGGQAGTANAPAPAAATVSLAQGPSAPYGFRYAVTLAGFPARSAVDVTCHDSVDPETWFTFAMYTDGAGNASIDNECYSGYGPSHWVQAGGIESNHVQWGPGSSTPSGGGGAAYTGPGTTETTGGQTNTWTDYSDAGGTQGPTISGKQSVAIACKVTGFTVADGNTAWYQIASSPWNGTFYASADAFYNNGATSGSLNGTPYVDNNVPDCGQASPPPPSSTPTYGETTGGVTHTFTDYSDAGGNQGPSVPSNETVQITCKVDGFKVADGNTNWYQIASGPWSNSYYASSDAFYNNGATSGSLNGTPYVDPNVPYCPGAAPAPPPPAPPAPAPTYGETTGGVTHTFTNYSNAGGTQGPSIPTHTTVQITCVVQGFRVSDGNTNWYEIASSPWNNTYFASADAFYNNGATSGSLNGTPYVDPSIPSC